jgi:hypothetical protein
MMLAAVPAYLTTAFMLHPAKKLDLPPLIRIAFSTTGHKSM